MKARVEPRLSNSGDAGFVYVNDTRMGYAPGAALRKEWPKAIDALVLWQSAQWRTPNMREISTCVDALIKRFPRRTILVDAEDGLTPMHEPQL